MSIALEYKPALFVQPGGNIIDGQQFAAMTVALASRLENFDAVVNLCEDRALFAATLGAGLIADTVNILPPNTTAATIRDCSQPDRSAHNKVAVITDSLTTDPSLELAHISAAECLNSQSTVSDKPISIDTGRIVAEVYTSGSTGKPVAHAKRWKDLLIENQFACERLFQLNENTSSEVGVVATVPAQHMYGLETSVLTALQGNAIVFSGKPLYPADIVTALDAIPSPRTLVTTPAHLRVLVKSGVEIPNIAQVISATAPLDGTLAKEAAERLKCPIKEIYGCTEAGSIASREQLVDTDWRLYPSMALSQSSDGSWLVSGPQLPQPQPLADQIEPQGKGRFRLLGRNSDLLNIAGKRASAGDIVAKLKSLAAVDDAAVYCPSDLPQGRVARLNIVLECSQSTQDGTDTTVIEQAKELIASYFDPVFQPRKWLVTKQLPRNATGKVLAKDLALLFGDK